VYLSVSKYAHKKGEVVVPAGGETGGPHCLAEVHKLLKTALYFKQQTKKLTLLENPFKRKIQELKKPSRGYFHPTLP